MHKCPITQKEIKSPVFSPITQLVYEREAIEKEIDQKGTCPIKNKQISKNDLFEVKNSTFTVQNGVGHVSVIGILEKIRKEYNAIIYERAALTKELNEVQSELNEKLSKNQAAILVIARLLKERDEVIDILNKYKSKYGVLDDEEEEIDK